MTLADLARKVRRSPPSVAERMKRLEDVGVIEGYAARINPQALGLKLAAWLRIRPIPGQLQKVADILRGLPAIVERDRVSPARIASSPAPMSARSPIRRS